MDRPKQYLQVRDKSILEHTLSCFTAFPVFKKILLGISADDIMVHALSLESQFPVLRLYKGGAERAETVLNGLIAITEEAKDDDWVWVHDAARPCLSGADINNLFKQLDDEPCGLVLAVPLADTLKRSYSASKPGQQEHRRVKATVDRSHLWRAMTPQIFRFADLKRALIACRDQGVRITDESSAIEYAGGEPRLVQGSDNNIKVTLAEDLNKVDAYLKQKEETRVQTENNSDENKAACSMRKQTSMFPRIGTGFDVHAFGSGDFITLGGVRISHTQGLVAHSDGDVLLHALMDAMLGALALGDIGKHFPDTDVQWKGADSRKLLRHVNYLIREQGYVVGNIDSTIIAQAPKMAPHITHMQRNIAKDLEIEESRISIKATTTESLGFTGRKEGIACQASVILLPAEYLSELS